MNCSHYGCDCELYPHDRGECFVCPRHGPVMGLLWDDLIDLRVAQAKIEIADMVSAGSRFIFH